jgi:adenylosuccinate synthase
MKADVLSGFKSLKICTSYIYQGKEIQYLPYNIEQEKVTPVFTEFSGWEIDLSTLKSKDEFPQTFKDYIQFIENFIEVPIKIVSVGPDRTQTIHR